ncbi:hypothetical protein B0H65DRAFT_551635 [Neurospora tetraspora]|uniref:Uncharacterized protein n=1 Tax=Neurospora tetraspora TaxID=94610 RepID=A0AAE0MP22_9PEZI|nr:hypothetical protein B0H65DRAFT_551635 [Neurospora tetraspora]
MEYITATEPTLVWDYETLRKFRQVLGREDPVILSVDFENVDHLVGAGITHYEKMSELGVAIYDTKKRPSSNDRPKAGDNSNRRLESLAKFIISEHIITEEFRNKTEETCDAPYHRRADKNPGLAHHARPYHCRFVESTFLSKEDTIQRLRTLIQDVSTQNLTDDEKAAGATRAIKIITWASHCEESTFYHGGLNPASLGLNIELWDYQLWYPFRARFHENPNSRNAKTKGEKAFSSLGALGEGLPLHNGCNDTVAQLIAFLRFMVMTEGEWTAWFDQKVDLAPISFDWVSPNIYRSNLAKAPIPEPKVKGKGKWKGNQKGGNNRNYQGYRQPKQTTSWKPTQAETAPSSNSTPKVLADKMANLNLEQSSLSKSTPSDSSSTGWPEGMDGFSDWSQSSKNSSGDNTSSGWPDDMDYPAQNNGFEDSGNNAQHDNARRGWPNSADNGEEHSDLTIKALNHDDSFKKAPKKEQTRTQEKHLAD